MKDKKTLLVVLVVLVLLIGGAGVLYSRLGSQFQMPQLGISGAGTAVDEEAAGETVSGDKTEENQAGNIPGNTRPGESAEGSQSEVAADNATETEPAMETVPDFTVYDREGNEVQLSDFRGKPVILNFWASWCGPCKSEMPDFEEIYQEYGEEIHFLMVNMTDGYQETLESAQEFLDETDYTFPVYFDLDYEAAYAYGVSSLPTTYFIDAEGYGVAYGMGAMDRETLEQGIALLNLP